MKNQKNQKTSRQPKGVYILIIKLAQKQRIKVGALGDICFNEGYYAYIGSALNGLESRIKRHLGSSKKLHWHIDYLLEKAAVEVIVSAKTEKRIECELAELFAEEFRQITRFGSGDCRCNSHLFYSERGENLESIACDAIKSRGMNPEMRRYGKGEND